MNKQAYFAVALVWKLIALAGVAHSADRWVDTLSAFHLNAPSLDCFRTFDVYYLKKAKIAYHDAKIACAGSEAYIHYASKAPYL